MASVTKRGDSYRITVSHGHDSSGKRLRETLTWTPEPNMTEKQIEKELNKQVHRFEDKVEKGKYLDGEKTTFAEFTEKWLRDYAEKELAPGTLQNYKMRLEKRIIPALGHHKIAMLQPHHLLEFYNNLAEEDIRLDTHYTPTAALLKALEPLSTPDLVKKSGVTFKTCQRIKKGSATTKEIADKLCAALGVDFKKMFSCNGEKKLSKKTIKHHHGIVSSILSTAVEWNIITDNPAKRVNLDGKKKVKAKHKYKPKYYNDKQVLDMFAAIEEEPLRYKAMIYLTIDTGIRTGDAYVKHGLKNAPYFSPERVL